MAVTPAHRSAPPLRRRMAPLAARARTLAAIVALSLLSGCAALDHGILNAQGPVAAHERHFFIIVCGILLFVWVPIVVLAPVIAWHYRLSNTHHAYRPKWAFSWPLEGFIWIPPIGIVVLLAVLLWPATQKDDPYTRQAGRGTPVRVQAIALDWKWVFIYPDEGVATVNQLAVPAGRPVHLSLTSGTVMQSLLLPQLAGQVYAMAGMRTRMNFAADRPGTYRGENTQFSGKDFARQQFPVVSMSPAAYAGWLARAHRAHRPLDRAAWAALSRPGTSAPQTYSTVPPRLFDRIVAATGGAAHPHDHSVTRKAP